MSSSSSFCRTFSLTRYSDSRGLEIGATDANGKFHAARPGSSAPVPGASRRVSLSADWELAAFKAFGHDWRNKDAGAFAPAAAAVMARAGILVTL